MPSGYYTEYTQDETGRKMAIPTRPRQRAARMSAPSGPEPMDPFLARVADLPLDLHRIILSQLTKDTQFSRRPYGTPKFLDRVQGKRLITLSNPKPPAILQVDQCTRQKLAILYYNQTTFYVDSEETCVAWLQSLDPTHRHLISKICFLPSAMLCGCLSRTACMQDLDMRAARLATFMQSLYTKGLHPRSADALNIWVCDSLLSQQDLNDIEYHRGHWTSRHEVIFEHMDEARIERYQM